MKNHIHFSFRIDMWTDDGENVIEHLAGVEDFTSRWQPSGRPVSGGPKQPSR
jgi:hypothetical protein